MRLERKLAWVFICIVIIFLTMVLVPIGVSSKTIHSLPGKDTKSLSVIVYNQGRMLVNEVREITLDIDPKPFDLVFEGVPMSIDPTTLQIRSSSTAFIVLNQNYEYDLINTKNKEQGAKKTGNRLTYLASKCFILGIALAASTKAVRR